MGIWSLERGMIYGAVSPEKRHVGDVDDHDDGEGPGCH